MNVWTMDVLMDGWTDIRKDRRMDGRTNEQTNEYYLTPQNMKFLKMKTVSP